MIVIIVLFAVLFGVGGRLPAAIPFGFVHDISFLTFDHPLLASTSFILLVGIPLAVLIYSIVASIAGFTPVSKSVKWIIPAVWILALILLLSSGFGINKAPGFLGWQLNVADNIRDSDICTGQEYVIDQQPLTGSTLTNASINMASDLGSCCFPNNSNSLITDI